MYARQVYASGAFGTMQLAATAAATTTMSQSHMATPTDGRVALRGVLEGKTGDDFLDVGGVAVSKERFTGWLQKNDHAQYRESQPGARTHWTKFIAPRVFTAAFAKHAAFKARYTAHAYQEFQCDGFALDGDGIMQKSPDANRRVVLSYKIAKMNRKILGLIPVRTMKLMINAYDPVAGIQTSRERTYVATPLGVFSKQKNTLVTPDKKNSDDGRFHRNGALYDLPTLHGEGSTFEFTDGDWQFAVSSVEGAASRALIKAGADFGLMGTFSPYGEGHGDIVEDRKESLIRQRAIQWWQPQNLVVSSGANLLSVPGEQVTSLGDYAQGFPPKKHSWDWATFSGETADGRTVRAIFEGVRSVRDAAAKEQKGWVDFIVHEPDGRTTEFRVFGKVGFDYDTTDIAARPWRVSFKDDRGNVMTLDAASLGQTPEDESARVPLLVNLDFMRLLAGGKLSIQARSWPWFGERDVTASGRSSLESAKMQG